MKRFFVEILSKKNICYFLITLFIFIAVFFMSSYRLMHHHGNWKYLISNGDDYGYWAYAKGFIQDPQSDGNPFYYEEQGKHQSIPYTASIIVGLLSKIFHVDVLFFYPWWAICMPTLLWASLFLCLTRIWKLRNSYSAIFSILVIFSAFFMQGQIPMMIHRFSRPMDSLWLSIFWLSLVMHSENLKKSHLWLLCILILFTVWLNPFLGMLGFIVTFLELIWRFFAEKNKKHFFKVLWIFIAAVLSFASILMYFKTHAAINPGLVKLVKEGNENLPESMEISSLLLYGFVCLIIYLRCRFLKKPVGPLDRLMIFLFLMEPISTHVQLFLNSNYQFANHRYYYWIIEVVCLSGWFMRFLNEIKNYKWFPMVERLTVIALVGLQIYILFTRWLNPFIFGLSQETNAMPDNSLRLIAFVPAIMLLLWVMFRLKHYLNRIRSYLVILLLLFISLGSLTWQNRSSDISYLTCPFDGAYQWFNKNAAKNDVVLTISPAHQIIDYVILYTNLKTYINPYGEILSGRKENEDNIKRFVLYLTLISDSKPLFLDRYARPIQEQLMRPKLDYILIDLPSPFLSITANKLKNYVTQVYRDDKCLIWKVVK